MTTMTKRTWTAAIAVAAATTLLSAQTAKTRFQLATLAPAGSVWDKELKQMATAWQKAGSVTVSVRGGGALGDEPEIAASIRSRRPNPEVAAFTAVGLSIIDKAFAVFGLPYFFDSYDELFHVLDRMTPVLGQRLDDKGLVLLAWGHVGWAQVFTTKPTRTLAELKQLKIWTSTGDEGMLRWYHAHGFQSAVAKPMTEILLGLRTGAIEALPTSPAILNYSQWYTQAKFMIDLGIAPIIGAVVIAKPTWVALAEADKSLFLAAARQMESRLKTAIPGQDKTTISEMVNRGLLTVVKAEGPEWKTEARALSSSMQSDMVPKDMYDLAVKERDAFRQKKRP